MRVLELRTINLDARSRIPEQRFCHGFDHARLARPSRPQEQQIPNWTSRRIQSRQEHLINLYNLLHRLVLSHNPAAKGGFKLSCIVAATVRIEHCGEIRSHKSLSANPDVFPFGRLGSSLDVFSDCLGQAPAFFGLCSGTPLPRTLTCPALSK